MVLWGFFFYLCMCTIVQKVHERARYLNDGFQGGISDGRGSFEESQRYLIRNLFVFCLDSCRVRSRQFLPWHGMRSLLP